VFSVQWEPDAAELEVDVERGEVRVQGPGLDGKGTALTAGDSLRLGKSEPAEPAPQVQQMPPAPLTPPADDGEEAEEPAQEHKPKAAAPTWKSLAAEGRYKEAMDAAEAEGFDTLLAKLGQADLWELARAARYARKGPKAVAALEAFRQRFPGSTKADTAAFLLGRVEMELNKKPGRAVQWFRAYLKQSPDGPLAEEARGRLIDAHLKSGNEAAAKQAASSYLAKHKEGVFKALAESVLAQ
jgi:TolA-binding protein